MEVYLILWAFGWLTGWALAQVTPSMPVIALLVGTPLYFHLLCKNHIKKLCLAYATVYIGVLWSYCFSMAITHPIYFFMPTIKTLILEVKSSLLFCIEASFEQPKIAKTLILGHKDLPFETKESFKRLGIYHLLIVSGLHVSLFCKTVQSIFHTPLRGFYSAKLISGFYFMLASRYINYCIIGICIFYGLLLGESSPGQRAAICFATNIITQQHQPSLRVFPRTLLAICLQSFIFPQCFISSSNFLSWSIYLFVSEKHCFNKLLATLYKQLKITVFILAMFNSISFIGVFLNLVFIPYFNLLFCIFFLSALLTTVNLPQFTLLSESYLTSVLTEWLILSNSESLQPYLYWDFSDNFLFLQLASTSAAIIFLFRSLLKMTRS